MTTPSAPPQRTTETVHTHQPPPQTDETIRHIAEILLAAYAAHKTAEALALYLKPFGLTRPAISAALALAGKGTATRPNARLKGVSGARTTGVVREVRDTEAYYRAAYVFNAARRITADLSGGDSLPEAIKKERPNTRAHEQARRNRLNIASKMQKLARQFGPLLGWYRDPLSDSESECVQADGHNFYATQGTIIGYPGSVHPHCRCVAGPPHPGGGMVNEHVHVSMTAPIARTFKLKK